MAKPQKASEVDTKEVLPLRSETRDAWRRNLRELPRIEHGGRLPVVFYAHGHPGIYFSKQGGMIQDSTGPLNKFLRDLGPALMEKYEPKALVIFSAHWDTRGPTMVSDWGEDQPLFKDYFNFPKEYYDVEWRSDGDSKLSRHVVELLKASGIPARTTGADEPRGRDGTGRQTTGFDHGAFIPNLLMFPQSSAEDKFPIPVVQVSIAGSLDPQDEFALGKAVSSLRDEGVLILAGGLTIHTFRDWSSWKIETAKDEIKAFESNIVRAAEIDNTEERMKALAALAEHPGFRMAHDREDHFAPIWVAAGAGSRPDDKAKVITDMFGCKTIMFGA